MGEFIKHSRIDVQCEIQFRMVKSEKEFLELYKNDVSFYNKSTFSDSLEEYKLLRRILIYLKFAMEELEFDDILDLITHVKPKDFTELGIIVHLQVLNKRFLTYFQDFNLYEKLEQMNVISKYIVFDDQFSYNNSQNVGYASPPVILLRNGNYKMFYCFLWNYDKVIQLNHLQNEFNEEHLADKTLQQLKIHQFCAKFSKSSTSEALINKTADLSYRIKLFNFGNYYHFFLKKNTSHLRFDLFYLAIQNDDVDTLCNFIKAGFQIDLNEFHWRIYRPGLIKLNFNIILLLLFLAGISHKFNFILQYCNYKGHFGNILKWYETNPFTLKNHCRRQLRKYLSKLYNRELFYHIFELLNMPSVLQSFLKMEDISYIYGPANEF